jgi:hypothetical protein
MLLLPELPLQEEVMPKLSRVQQVGRWKDAFQGSQDENCSFVPCLGIFSLFHTSCPLLTSRDRSFDLCTFLFTLPTPSTPLVPSLSMTLLHSSVFIYDTLQLAHFQCNFASMCWDAAKKASHIGQPEVRPLLYNI